MSGFTHEITLMRGNFFVVIPSFEGDRLCLHLRSDPEKIVSGGHLCVSLGCFAPACRTVYWTAVEWGISRLMSWRFHASDFAVCSTAKRPSPSTYPEMYDGRFVRDCS